MEFERGSSIRRRGGNDVRGYEIVPSPMRRVLGIRIWGLWDYAFVREYRADMLEVIREMSGSPWSVLLDARGFPAQPDDVSAIRLELMVLSKRSGMRRIASLTGSAVTKLQTQRLVEESRGEVEFFDDEEDALEWIERISR